MTDSPRDPKERAPREIEERRCIVTGEAGSKDGLIRFVAGPEGRIVPDLAGRLPGRGLWVSARREAVETAVRKGLFARAARASVEADEALAGEVERLLARRAGEALGLARKSGALVTGFEKVMSLIAEGRIALLIEARDGSQDGRRKLEGAIKAAQAAGKLAEVPTLSPLWADEMGLALGRANVIHAALTKSSMAEKVLADLARLESYGRTGRPRNEGQA